MQVPLPYVQEHQVRTNYKKKKEHKLLIDSYPPPFYQLILSIFS